MATGEEDASECVVITPSAGQVAEYGLRRAITMAPAPSPLLVFTYSRDLMGVWKHGASMYGWRHDEESLGLTRAALE